MKVKAIPTQIYVSEDEEKLLREAARSAYISLDDLFQSFAEDGIKKVLASKRKPVEPIEEECPICSEDTWRKGTKLITDGIRVLCPHSVCNFKPRAAR